MPEYKSNQADITSRITDLQNIPAELRQRRQWVVYSLEPGEDNRLIKMPRQANGGARAASNDPLTWNTFDACIRAWQMHPQRFAGIGYIVSPDDPYTGIDLDHCVNTSTGEIEQWARAILNQIDSYAEFSQSGTGIHILANASKPGARCRIAKHPNIELYDNRRFLVMTGNLVPNTCGAIQPAPNEIAALYHELFGDEQPEPRQSSKSGRRSASDINPGASGNTSSAAGALSDSDIISRACAASNGDNFKRLWNGDTGDYNNDHSAADYKLCKILAFWTARNAEQMDRLFRESGLMRSKWNESRPGGTYGSNTIARAISDCKNVYIATGKSSKCKSKSVTTSTTLDTATGEIIEDNFSPTLKHLTDLGNAEYMIDLYGHDLHFNVDRGLWLYWTGMLWQVDETGHIERLACNSVRSLYELLKDVGAEDPDKAKKLLNHIIKSESRPRLEAQIKFARSLPGVPVKSRDLDSDPWLLNCQNGTVDLRTGELREHKQSDLLSQICRVDYIPDAQCPRWIQFLNEVFLDDQELIAFVRRMIGYCLTGDTREESVFILLGKGQCGKSKFIEIIRDILGDYVKNTAVTTFVERNDTSTADIADLVGARVVTASEASEEQAFNEPLLKRVTGRDPITCCFKYRDYFTYIPTYKVLFATNDVPRMRSQSFAMKRRIKIIPFRQRFYDPDDGKQPVKDDQIGAKLAAEASGILAWAVQGCLEWQRDGLKVPDTVRNEVNKLFDAQDPLAEFIDSECISDYRVMIPVGDLWDAYQNWCENNKRRPAFKQCNWFSRSLTQRDGLESDRGMSGVRIIYGLTLKSRVDNLPLDAIDANNVFFRTYPHERVNHEEVQKNSLNASIASPVDSSLLDDPFADADDEVA